MSAALSFARFSGGYRQTLSLKTLTVAFAAGTVSGLVGPNGAGKTTLLRAALGIVPASSGGVFVQERPIAEWTREALARTVSYLPQDADVHWPVSARRLVALGRLPHRPAFAPLSVRDAEAIDSALARCDAVQFADRRVDELSSGERARVLLARSLATQASILLVDEPAAHLDPAHQLRLMELLRAEAQRGAAVVVTLHDLALASRFCDSVIVLHKGRLVAADAPAAALTGGVLRSVFGVEAWSSSAFPDDLQPVVPWRRL